MTWLRRIAEAPLWAMLWKELVQLRRDRLTLGMMLGIPAIQLVLFGYAIQTEVRHLPTVVLDESRTSESRRLVEVFRNSGNFDIVARVPDRAALRAAIETGRANAAVVIPPEFMRDVRRGRSAQAQVIVDAADPLASSSALSSAQLAAAARAAEIAGPGPAPLDVRVRPWYNPGLRSAVYIVPGIIGVLLSLTLVLITSMAIVRERERGTLEQLIVTPIDKTSLMLGKILPFLLIGYVQITVILALGWILFRVPVLGSLPLLYLLSFAFIVASLALGLLMSTLVRSQVQAMQLSFMFLHAEHPALRLHVSAAGHAGAGPMDRRGAAAHLLPHDSPWRPAQGRRSRRALAPGAGPRRLRDRTGRAERHALPQDDRVGRRPSLYFADAASRARRFASARGDPERHGSPLRSLLGACHRGRALSVRRAIRRHARRSRIPLARDGTNVWRADVRGVRGRASSTAIACTAPTLPSAGIASTPPSCSSIPTRAR